MPILVGLQLRRTRDKIYADAGHHDLNVNDKVIIETSEAQEAALVVEPERMVEKNTGECAKVLRKISGEDYKRLADNKDKEKKAFQIIVDNIEVHDLNMKLTCIDYTFDRSKLFVYYTAENRVDFRNLIKDLGHALKTRIQMVQIGVRDETKIMGGLGACGEVLCCARFLKEFSPVSMDMAKDQDIALNIAKISGVCGRLMCCLAYEHDVYCQARKKLPAVKTKVSTPEGEGTVVSINCLKEEVSVDLGEGKIARFPNSSVKPKQ